MRTPTSNPVRPRRAVRLQAFPCLWLSGLLLLLVSLARGQDTTFSSDPSGNLWLVQPAGTLAPPRILVQPQVQVVGPGELASFLVVAEDPRGLSYQWSFNGTNLSGATADTLLLTNVTAANQGQYAVVLANSSASVASAPAWLWLDSNGNGLPDSWELAYFGNLTNIATGDFDHDGVSNLQEFLDGTNPTNSASALFRLTLLQDGGTVVADPDQAAYTNGQTVVLTATGDASHAFQAWTGAVVSRSNVISVTMTNNQSLYAHFSPLTFFWSASGSGDWNVASNWTPSLVPGSNDSVIIQSGATVALNSDIQLTDLVLGGPGISPTLSVAGDLTVLGQMTWASGTMTGAGRTVIAPGATLTIAFLNAISLTSRTLENGGTVFWTGSGTIPLTDASVTNRPGGIFEVQNVGAFGAGTAPYRFDNAGILRKTVNAGQFTVGQYIPFNNYGSVDIQAGTLSLAGGGFNQGTMSVAAGAWLDLSLGTFTASADSTITGAGNLSVSGSTANLQGLVNLSGTHTFSAGAVNLTGTYFCTNNTLNIYGADVAFNGNSVVTPLNLTLTGGPRGGSLGGTNQVTVLDQMNWTGGNMWGGGRTLIAPGATLTLHAVTQTLGPRTLENAGTTVVVGTGSSGFDVNEAVITNRPGAVFEVQNTGNFGAGGSPRFDNAGLFRKSVSSGQFTIGQYIAFNNYGAVEIQVGTLSLGGGGFNQGTISVPAGCTLDLAGGTFVNYPAASITGAGNLSVSGATANLDGLVNLAGTHSFSAGTANLTGTYFCTNNTLNITGGDANFNGASVVSPLILNQTAGYRSGGDLGGTNLVTVLGQMNWNSGNMWGGGRTLIAPGATLTLHAVTQTLGPRTLDNAGTTLVVGTGSSGFNVNAAVITNRPGAVFEVQNTGNFGAGGTPRFDNAGLFRKSVSSGQFTIGQYIAFNNYGAVEIQVGTLSLGGGGFNQGTISVPAGCTLDLAGGTFVNYPAASITGAGNLSVSGATANLDGLVNLAGTHSFSAGTANVTGTYFCTNNTLNITGGDANFNGASVVSPLILNQTAGYRSGGDLGGTNLVTVLGQMNWNSGNMWGGGRTLIAPGATLTLHAVSQALGPRTLDNAGTTLVVGTGSSGLGLDAAVVTNQPGAVFEVQCAGNFTSGATPNRFENAGAFRKTTNTGQFTVGQYIPFNNYGTVDLERGTLVAAGGYNCVSNSLLQCALGGATAGAGYAQLNVAGAVNLQGGLSVNLANGFLPQTNATFAVVTAGTRNGAFSSFAYPTNAVTMELSNTTSAVIVLVTGVLPPPPVLLTPRISGTNLVLTWTSISNIVYRVESNPDLNPTHWNVLPGDLTASSNITTRLDPLTSSNRFYRVHLLQ